MDPTLADLGLRARTKLVCDQVEMVEIFVGSNYATNEYDMTSAVHVKTPYATACLIRLGGDLLMLEQPR